MKKKMLLALSAASLLATATVAAAPAPPLSYVQIRYVGSSTQGWEPIADGNFTTSLDHGGALMRVVTVEVGYGSSRIARMNGSVLPSSANYQSDAFCSSNFLTPCQPGQTIVGFTRYWNVDGYPGGTFSYQSTSINYPFNTMSDTLNIL
jgi:Domain of unknown function (DUF4879)